MTRSIRIFCLAALLLTGCRTNADVLFVPSNPPEMKRLTGTNSPAHQIAQRFRRGVNLGDYLEVDPGHNWGVTVDRSEFTAIRAEGFDHVRLPVKWSSYIGPGPDYQIAADIFKRADFAVGNALSNQLSVILNIHHFSEFDRDPHGQADKLVAMWRQIAAHYAAFTNALAFELLNEPHETAGTLVVNSIYPRVISEIRKTNPHRAIFVQPGNWGGITEITSLVLPADDSNLIVSVHCYDPFYFTHQGAGWAGDDVQVTGIQFPGPPAKPLVPGPALKLNSWVVDWVERYNTLPTERNPSGPAAFADKVKLLRAWSDHYGRPVHLGEFGAYTKADHESRVRYYRAMRHALEENRVGWAIWDWTANFRYWDAKNKRALPGMHEALFQ